MLDSRKCDVHTAAELDNEIRDILALDQIERGDEICGTLHVHYSDYAVKRASLLPMLERRSVAIAWHKNGD